MNKIRSNNKGMTIVEVAISMTLLVILTITALMIINSGVYSTASSVYHFKAYNQVNDYIEIFQECDDEDSFKSLISKAFNVEFSYHINNTLNVLRDGVTCNTDITDNVIVIKAYIGNDFDNVIYEYYYSKG